MESTPTQSNTIIALTLDTPIDFAFSRLNGIGIVVQTCKGLINKMNSFINC